MAEAGVKLKFYGDSASAEAAVAKLEQKLAALENAQKQSSAKAKTRNKEQAESSDAMWSNATNGVTGYLAKMVAVGTVVSLISNAIGAIVEKNTAWSNSIGDMDKKMDDMRAKLGIQLGGVGEKLSGKAIERATDIAMATPSTGSAIAAADISRKLSSAGFKEDLLKSGILEEQSHRLNILTGNVGEGAEPLAGADMLIQGLKGLKAGTEITPEIVSQLVTELGNAFQASTAEKPQLVQYAKKAGLLQALGGDRREGLAAFAMAQETMGGEETATGLKNLALGFNAIKEGSEKAKVMEGLGLKPDELHMSKTGGMLASVRMLKERMAKTGMDKPAQDVAMKELFGEQGLSVADFVMSKEQEIGALAGTLGDEGATEKVRQSFMKSDLKVRNRQQLESEKIRMKEAQRAGVTYEDIERATSLVYERRRLEAGSDFGRRNAISAEQAASVAAVEAGKKAGLSPEQVTPLVSDDVLIELRKQSGYLEAQSRRNANRNGNVEKVELYEYSF